jgi:hypothetical protein
MLECTFHYYPLQLGRRKVSVISYDFVSKLKETLGHVPHFSVIVCDEAHYIKTHTSQRCKATLPLLQVHGVLGLGFRAVRQEKCALKTLHSFPPQGGQEGDPSHRDASAFRAL